MLAFPPGSLVLGLLTISTNDAATTFDTILFLYADPVSGGSQSFAALTSPMLEYNNQVIHFSPGNHVEIHAR